MLRLRKRVKSNAFSRHVLIETIIKSKIFEFDGKKGGEERQFIYTHTLLIIRIFFEFTKFRCPFIRKFVYKNPIKEAPLPPSLKIYSSVSRYRFGRSSRFSQTTNTGRKERGREEKGDNSLPYTTLPTGSLNRRLPSGHKG